MPKKDLTAEECEDILEQAEVGYLSMSHNDRPYCLPFNFAYEQGRIYIHTGLKGLKWEYLSENPNVCFVVADQGRKQIGDSPCQYTYKFVSVIAFGKVYDDISSRETADSLAKIIDKYKAGTVSSVPEDKMAKVRVVRIDIDRITGRQNL